MHNFVVRDEPCPQPSWVQASNGVGPPIVLATDPEKVDYALLLRRMGALGLKKDNQIMWSHVALERETDQIRLLALLPGEVGNEIRCKEVKVYLKDSVAFEALSYTWGDPHNMHFITFEDRPFPVTENLYLALEQLRPKRLPRYLWIDAVCIDQLNDFEKSAQVQLMGDIFARASRVIAWLGKAEDDSDLAFDFLNGQYFVDDETSRHLNPNIQAKPIQHVADQKWETDTISTEDLRLVPGPSDGKDGEDEEDLRKRGLLPRWLSGKSSAQGRAQHVFLNADTILLPVEGRCRQCDRHGIFCWGNGQDPCVRCLVNADNVTDSCSFLESRVPSLGSCKVESSQQNRPDVPTVLTGFVASSMRSTSEISEKAKMTPNMEKVWLALIRLAERSWWRRVWVLQEMAVNEHDPIILCGSKITSWHTFHEFVHQEAVVSSRFSDPRLGHIYMCTQTYPPLRKNFRKGSALSLAYLLKTSLGLEATDSRDKVFSLLSLALPIDRLGCKPDYSLPTETVYTQTALHIIQTTGKLDILSYNTASNNPLPSWVPDWSLGTSRHYPIWASDLYNASGNRAAEIYRNSSPTTLTIQGFAISSITHIGQPIQPLGIWPVFSPSDFKAIIKSLETLVLAALGVHLRSNADPNGSPRDLAKWWRVLALDPDPRNSDAFWRTLVCDAHQDPAGYHSPADAHWAELFELVRYGTNESEDKPLRRRLSQKLQSVEVQAPRLRTPVPSRIPEYFKPELSGADRVAEFAKPLLMRMAAIMLDRRLFVTESGHMGLTPGDAREGDIVFILSGGDVPFIMRNKAGDPRKIGVMQFIGEAYVHGLMRGELFEEFKGEDLKGRVFEVE